MHKHYPHKGSERKEWRWVEGKRRSVIFLEVDQGETSRGVGRGEEKINQFLEEKISKFLEPSS